MQYVQLLLVWFNNSDRFQVMELHALTLATRPYALLLHMIAVLSAIANIINFNVELMLQLASMRIFNNRSFEISIRHHEMFFFCSHAHVQNCFTVPPKATTVN